MIRLHHAGPSAASLRIALALDLLGLDYTAQRVDLARLENWSDSHRRLDGDGNVPVLEIDGLCLADSAIALLYLAEAHAARALLPVDSADRYDAQTMIDRLDGFLLESVDRLGWTGTAPAEDRMAFLEALEAVPMRPKLSGWSAVWRDAETDVLARARDKIADGLALIETALAGEEWLTPGEFGVVDIAAIALTRMLPELLHDEDLNGRWPHFMAWQTRCAKRLDVGRAVERLRTGPDFAPPR
jgi:glutathione S-transferase